MLCLKILFENCAFGKIMWKSIVDPDWPQMTIKNSACALHAGYLRHKNTGTHLFNTYIFPTATMDT
jgi:hypothetical protein